MSAIDPSFNDTGMTDVDFLATGTEQEGDITFENKLFPIWQISDPAQILKILKSDLVACPDIASLIAKIEVQWNISLPSLRFATSCLPIFLEAGSHAVCRRSIGAYLSDRNAMLRPVLEEKLPALLSPLEQRGTVDLANSVVKPIVDLVLKTVLEIPLPDFIWDINFSSILNLDNYSVSRLRKLDSEFEAVISAIKTPTQSDAEMVNKFAFLFFARQSLFGTLIEGIVRSLAESNSDRPIRLELPDFPPGTSTPVTYRTALKELKLNKFLIPPGATLRLQLDRFLSSQNPQFCHFIFGAGRHSCLGKNLTMTVWSCLREQVNRIKVTACISSYKVGTNFVVKHDEVIVRII